MDQRRFLHRREFLKQTAAGLAAGSWLHPALSLAASLGDGHPLAPRPGHFPARAKRLVLLFLTGGFSHVDTFDPKPRLRADHGKKLGPGYALGSPFEFKPCGRSGLPVSDLFPHLGTVADELCVIRTLHTDIVEHFQAALAMHTGSATIPMPSLGSWISYGLGTFNPNLPSFVVIAEHLPYAGAQVWDQGFLPPYHQGVRILPGDTPIADLRPPARPVTLEELQEVMLRDLNERHAALRPDDLKLLARQKSFETARGMMREAPGVFDLSGESEGSLAEYGVRPSDNRSFAWQCLVARRLLERGVRVVEVIDTGSQDNWDAHGNMEDHRPKAARVDQAIAALVRDLKRRGLLSDTLIACSTEFGRTPWGSSPAAKGREHHARAFSCLLMGGGVEGGRSYGETDEHGIEIVSNPAHVHDYHATILHLLGLDHTRLTYRYGGRDFRLTDVAGNVIREILA
jgi:hypothetical protein